MSLSRPAAPPEDQISQGGTGLRSITVPKGLLVEAIGNVFASISSVPAYVDITAPGLGQPAVHALYYNGLASVAIGGPFRCLTNASAQIGMTASNCVFSLSTLGYRDLRRRLF